jgi:hypothetical protein
VHLPPGTFICQVAHYCASSNVYACWVNTAIMPLFSGFGVALLIELIAQEGDPLSLDLD